ELNAVVNGQMWQGNEGCKRVSVGRNVVFHVERPQSRPMYLVDNPGVGAIYVFTTIDEAMQLANGTIRRSTAREDGCRRVIHSDGWQARVTKLLSALA